MTRIPEPTPFDLAVDDDGDAYFVVDCPRCEQHSRHAMAGFRPGDPLTCSCGAVIATLSAGNLEAMEDRLAGILGTLEETR
jgi:hypothetical protein